MNCSGKWSTPHYQPAVHSEAAVYIEQIIPYPHRIFLAFRGSEGETTVYYREKGSAGAWASARGESGHAVIDGLTEALDYEFYLKSKTGVSEVGYARTGAVPGTVVNYLHPEDPKYSFSGQHLCTPSLLRHPDGYLLASMDVFGRKTPQNLTLIFRSDDNGESWYHFSELFPCFWGTLFCHRGAVYMLAVSTEHGDLLIGRSDDGGKSFGVPTVLGRGSSRTEIPGWHKSALPVIAHKGRLWTAVDYGAHKTGGYANCLLSAPVDADLLDAASWSITEPLCFDPGWQGAVAGDERGFLEGNAVVSPSGDICNFLRYSTDKGIPNHGFAGILEGDIRQPEKQLRFRKFVPFPGNLSKFDIRWDEKSGQYFTIVSRIYDGNNVRARNLLSLAASPDLEHWTVLCDLLDYSHTDAQFVGFQYVSFCFDGEDILYLSRTAFNGARNYHDNNYITFHKIRNFRSLIGGK